MAPPLPTYSHLIVGSGVIGLSLAWELSQRGQSVKLLESSSEHPSASWAGAGILPPAASRNIVDPLDRLRSLSHQLHPNWARRLKESTGIDNGFRQCGGIYLATSRAEYATLVANQYWWDEHGIEYEVLNAKQLFEIESQISPSLATRALGAWRLPGECQLRNPRHLSALRAACVKGGVQFQQSTIQRVERAFCEGAELVDTKGQRHSAQKICLCTGAWTRLLMLQLEMPNGIMPIRGQMLLYKSQSPLLSNIVNEGHRYLVAREDGHMLAGSVEEETGYVIETTQAALVSIGNWAVEILPELGRCQLVKSWAGLRPGSFDGLPYIGSAPGCQNLWIAAGHFRSGLHLSCATAEIMADLMTDKAPKIDLTPFRIGRG